MPGTPQGLLLCDDLIFTSKVVGTARALNLEVQAVRGWEALLRRAGEVYPNCVLVDVQHPGLDLAALLAGLRQVCPVMPRVVGYGSHVEAQTLHAARLAGCDLVLPRSKFVEELPTALANWLAPLAARP